MTSKRYDIGCQLITNRKSHTGFWLVPTSVTWMTLNDVALTLRYFTEDDSFRGRLVTTSQWLKLEVRSVVCTDLLSVPW